jgi:hypothetical protein
MLGDKWGLSSPPSPAILTLMEAKRVLSLAGEHGKRYYVVQFGPEHFELFEDGHTSDTGRDVCLGRFKTMDEAADGVAGERRPSP